MGKRVISFCLWGDKPKYCIGAIRNAELAKQIYPDWQLLFFCGKSVPKEVLVKILKSNENAACVNNNADGGWSMMLDRLIPSLNPDTIDLFISRDCDSRLSMREKLAVDEWIKSDKTWHTMHCHAWHSVPILGGMFGVKKEGFASLWQKAESWQKSTKEEWQQDQNFLKEVIWPSIKNDVLNHADFHTNIWPGVPFPTPIEPGHFIGATYDEFDKIDKLQLERLYG